MSGPTGIVICNRKGGVGKTTVATNLAVKLATLGHRVALLDCDRQQSSSHWMSLRRHDDLSLSCVNAQSGQGSIAFAVGLRVPPQTEYVIYDAPACGHAHDLISIVRRAHLAIVPILPSPIDIAASGDFVSELLRMPEARSGKLKLGFVANRLREWQISSRKLKASLSHWNLPLLGELRDSQLYVYASGQGMAAHELRSFRAEPERAAWNTLIANAARQIHIPRFNDRPQAVHHPSVSASLMSSG